MRTVLIATMVSVVASSTTRAQQPPHGGGAPRAGGAHPAAHEMMTGPLGVPETRDGSGTAWLPDATPMYAFHVPAGAWRLMLHGNAFLQYIDEGSDRGDRQLGSVNWFMAMGHRNLAGGALALRAMLSAEPLTVGKCGYPDLLATGELCHGERLHDRQHPHDLFMELSARYDRALGRDVALELYGAPAGEPALGPVAYPHRISAMAGPLAPIGHHWQDATHISFGVATAGVYGRKWKLEGSIFNAREPDEDRYDIDLAALDSYAGRLWLLPSENVAVQLSTGFLNDAEEAHEPGGRADVHRSTASLTYHRPRAGLSPWATTLVWGQDRAHGLTTNSALLESSAGLSGRDVVFGRAEWVQKSGDDLALPEDRGLGGRIFPVGKVFVGYVRQFPGRGLLPGIGAQVDLDFVSSDLAPFYGSTTSAGFAVFASLRPAPMAMEHAAAARPMPAPPPTEHEHGMHHDGGEAGGYGPGTPPRTQEQP
ncbi:MAG TPA: hypothetical protein VFQ38_16555 [Longimicrobiales bacterium]|nr:hypothetical protein [Longimicrobiales bacterium]